MFNNIYNRRKVFITGITGFKGSWLTAWLLKMGADVYGVGLDHGKESHFHLLDLGNRTHTEFEDITAYAVVENIIEYVKPSIVFHLAAQPIVSIGYRNPYETFMTNIEGTLNVVDACIKNDVEVLINVTTDKVYLDQGWEYRYRENDRLGANDPYATSKACSDLITQCYRQSFPNNKLKIANARAGNVIGGGDWAVDRIIPDAVRAIQNKEPLIIRNPLSVRPWQHVLEALSGYLVLGQKLLENPKPMFCRDWNFGPSGEMVNVVDIISNFIKFGEFDLKVIPEMSASSVFKETHVLQLDSTLSKQYLQCSDVWHWSNGLMQTAHWYAEYMKGNIITDSQLDYYCQVAENKSMEWVK